RPAVAVIELVEQGQGLLEAGAGRLQVVAFDGELAKPAQHVGLAPGGAAPPTSAAASATSWVQRQSSRWLRTDRNPSSRPARSQASSSMPRLAAWATAVTKATRSASNQASGSARA